MFYKNRNEKSIFYEVMNEDSKGEVIVFLNGVMASTSSWINQYSVFKELGYKIILHDFLGQLRSEKFEGLYSFKEHCEDVKELLSFLKVENVHLIGTSYGGEVALKYAAMYPKEVRTISVIDSVSELDEKMINGVKEWVDLAKTYNGEKFFYGMMPSIYSEGYINKNKAFLDTRAKAMKQIPKEYFDGQVGLYLTFIDDVEMTSELKKIVCPSLIICGEKDTLKPPRFSKIIVDNIVNSNYITLPDCGHVSIFEKPGELNASILGFITIHS